MESDDECEFDSTWQDEDVNKTPKKKVLHRRSQRKMNAAKDMQNFRHSCWNLDGDENHDKPGQGRFYNLEFYRGQIKSSPDDVHIDDFHQKWWGKYDLLQDVTTFIQWLDPVTLYP
ncbi:hypothetical protein QQF64_003699 [Cirrhinus molitorella]|uniref:Opioid growth factor receptor (OGFr) conserved domain-containing protein n=1 Tax=Cirrhinus molitorella TaxID=172907 RepID=A0ABR3MM38_9TELE